MTAHGAQVSFLPLGEGRAKDGNGDRRVLLLRVWEGEKKRRARVNAVGSLTPSFHPTWNGSDLVNKKIG